MIINKDIKKEKVKRILAVGAHPDDVELGCGGVIAKHLENGDEVFVLVLTKGENGRHILTMDECFSSLVKLGIKKENIFFGNIPDGYIKDDYETVNFIETVIRENGVTRVYTHYPNDRHQDHRNCSNAVVSAARKIQEILLFEGPSTKFPFEPHYFVELSEDHMKKKIDALSCYQTQIKKNTVNLNALVHLASLHGVYHNSAFAEAFALNHLVRRGGDV